MAKLLILKGKKQYIEEQQRWLTVVKPKTYYVERLDQDYHTEHGIIKAEDLQKEDGAIIVTSQNKEMSVVSTSFIDDYKRIERSAQIIPLKDIGSIISTVGIGPDMTIVDAGAGSGAVSLMLARLCKHVTAYEVREDHFAIVQRNIEKLGIMNCTLKRGSIYEPIEERDVDVFTLDVPEPRETVGTVKGSLKVGGHVVLYNPSLVQISEAVEAYMADGSFELLKTVEILEREWEVQDRKVRPKTQGIGHSGFLCYLRRVKP